MSCKYTDLKINEKVHLIANPLYCYECNNQEKYEGAAIYKGHGELDSIIYDIFDIGPIICPSCGGKVTLYIEVCKGEVFIMEIPSCIEKRKANLKEILIKE